jgi:hypothetical protein
MSKLTENAQLIDSADAFSESGLQAHPLLTIVYAVTCEFPALDFRSTVPKSCHRFSLFLRHFWSR